ncbi:hypothetical protein ANN_26041 [Periplaneta americana]|uniref:Gag-like protein n=1 Tax=Periplaneta americana TaxID=6978 RepID=A0ABQ8S5M1_PERAM|nr:hypothetical protein ANN_26041 [Periplaneta americana]
MKPTTPNPRPPSSQPSSEDDSRNSNAKSESTSQPKRIKRKKKNNLTESTTIITTPQTSCSKQQTSQQPSIVSANSNDDTFAELNTMPTTTANRTVIITNCLPHLLTSTPISDEFSYEITAINETDRVLTFPSRQYLSSFTNKYPSTQFGPKAIYSCPPKATESAPWNTGLCPTNEIDSLIHPLQHGTTNNRQTNHNREDDAYTDPPSDMSEAGDWQQVNHKRNRNSLQKSHNPPTTTRTTTQPPIPTPTSSQQPQPPRYSLRISEHTINGNNPFFIHHLIHHNELIIEQPNLFWARSTSTTTLSFTIKDDLDTFINKIPATTFGPNAKYTITHGPTQRQTTTPPRDISVVMRDVASTIPLDALTDALLNQQFKVNRIVRIISAQTQRPTEMVRIFVDDVDTSNRLLTGVKLFGRNYRVEASREQIRHRPCARCAQYGHDATTCNNAPKCWKCGNNPAICKHKVTDNLKFCATCSDNSHYTGQMMCPRYPKATPLTTTAPTYRPIYAPPTPTIVNPSQMASQFPPLPSPATINHGSYATVTASLLTQKSQSSQSHSPDEPTKATTTLNTQTESSPQPELPNTAPTPTQSFHDLKQYIDEKMNEQEEKLAAFILAMFTTYAPPAKRLHRIKIANNAARKLMKKTIRHQFINNQLQFTFVPFRKVTPSATTMGLDTDNN